MPITRATFSPVRQSNNDVEAGASGTPPRGVVQQVKMFLKSPVGLVTVAAASAFGGLGLGCAIRPGSSSPAQRNDDFDPNNRTQALDNILQQVKDYKTMFNESDPVFEQRQIDIGSSWLKGEPYNANNALACKAGMYLGLDNPTSSTVVKYGNDGLLTNSSKIDNNIFAARDCSGETTLIQVAKSFEQQGEAASCETNGTVTEKTLDEAKDAKTTLTFKIPKKVDGKTFSQASLAIRCDGVSEDRRATLTVQFNKNSQGQQVADKDLVCTVEIPREKANTTLSTTVTWFPSGSNELKNITLGPSVESAEVNVDSSREIKVPDTIEACGQVVRTFEESCNLDFSSCDKK